MEDRGATEKAKKDGRYRWWSGWRSQRTGAAIGSVVPVVGTATGAVIGALLGRFVAGATAGTVTGSAMDGVLFDRYVCRGCEHTFD
jgi:DNA-directed RNA polymerase subunit N (RpoN/RPB10)